MGPSSSSPSSGSSPGASPERPAGPPGRDVSSLRRARVRWLVAALRGARAYHCRRCRAPVDRRSSARRPTCPQSLLRRRALPPAGRPERPSRGVLSDPDRDTTTAGRGVPVELDRRPAIERLLRTGRVQTNEVGRCAYLYPAFALVAEWSRRPLVIIELGASAGLNLMWDQYRYEYEGDASCGPSDATVVIRSAFRGDRRPRLPERAPAVVGRVGVDVVPIDVRDEDQTSWLRALVWPEHRERAALLASALALAQRTPPRVVRGDALACLPDLLREARRDAAVCVTHTHTLNQMTEGRRAALGGVAHGDPSPRGAHVLGWRQRHYAASRLL